MKSVEVDYSVFTLLTRGIIVDQIKVDQPAVRLRRDARGWNLSSLLKPRPQSGSEFSETRDVAAVDRDR